MKEHALHFYSDKPTVALVGNPNCGKTSLFNQLTGARQKVGNYAGVTVERKQGVIKSTGEKALRLVDLPGTYSLAPQSPDERVTVDVLKGALPGEHQPDLIVAVLDATQMRRGLRLLFALMRLQRPVVLCITMHDEALARGITIEPDRLAQMLGIPVVLAQGNRSGGAEELRRLLGSVPWPSAPAQLAGPESDSQRTDEIFQAFKLKNLRRDKFGDAIDRVVLHPVLGTLILAAILFAIFQAVFSWSAYPMDLIAAATEALAQWVLQVFPSDGAGGLLGRLLSEAAVSGVGGVLIFLPQILILFFFLILLEESGYLPRASFLLDRLMGTVGLSGRSFIPFLSGFACAIPGIMAARTVANPRDRLVTILIIPLATCSARLPVYALLIAAFVPAQEVVAGIGLQGLVLFVLYLAGILSAFVVAWVLKRFNGGQQKRPLLLELPPYRRPSARQVMLGLWQRALIFLRRVGGIIFISTVVLWLLVSFPAGPVDAARPAIEYSFAGQIGTWIAPVFAPIGFNWQTSIALLPGLAAREVVVSSLATIYAVGGGDEVSALAPVLAASWSTASAFALLAWFVFAPQCLATLAAIRRETGGWSMALLAAAYLFALSYGAAWVTYRVSLALGFG